MSPGPVNAALRFRLTLCFCAHAAIIAADPCQKLPCKNGGKCIQGHGGSHRRCALGIMMHSAMIRLEFSAASCASVQCLPTGLCSPCVSDYDPAARRSSVTVRWATPGHVVATVPRGGSSTARGNIVNHLHSLAGRQVVRSREPK